MDLDEGIAFGGEDSGGLVVVGGSDGRGVGADISSSLYFGSLTKVH